LHENISSIYVSSPAYGLNQRKPFYRLMEMHLVTGEIYTFILDVCQYSRKGIFDVDCLSYSFPNYYGFFQTLQHSLMDRAGVFNFIRK
jgi:hypothetical protein